jgi:hypothetical protein
MIQGFQHSVEFQLISVMNMKMFLIQLESIVNLIGMKFMKVIDNMRNAIIQEFQHYVEF